MTSLRSFVKDLLDDQWQYGLRCDPGVLQSTELDPGVVLDQICSEIISLVQNETESKPAGYTMTVIIDILERKHVLPDDTLTVWIEGATHSKFTNVDCTEVVAALTLNVDVTGKCLSKEICVYFAKTIPDLFDIIPGTVVYVRDLTPSQLANLKITSDIDI